MSIEKVDVISLGILQKMNLPSLIFQAKPFQLSGVPDHIQFIINIQNMNKIAIFIYILTISSAWSFLKTPQNDTPVSRSYHFQSLKFGNQSSAQTNASVLASFIKAANEASQIWGDNVAMNLDYITNYMNSYATEPYYEYFVLLQQYPETKTTYRPYLYKGILFSFANINSKYPNWSYFVYMGGFNPSKSYTTIEFYSKGSGITPQLEILINALIKAADYEETCKCYPNYQDVYEPLEKYDGQRWSVFCSDRYDLSARIDAKNDQWMFARPRTCSYLVYVI